MATTTRDEPVLRHIVLVGGTLGEWSALGEHAWEHRLAELGKVADHVGAGWLAIRPYGPDLDAPAAAAPATATGLGGATVAVLSTRADIVGGCTVTAVPEADGRARLVRVVESLRQAGSPIDEATIAAALNAPATVDPDLVVVLGPSHRLPPSLAWELAYSELVFVDVAWPDLQPAHLERAVDAFTHRHRRFGGLD